MLFFASQQVDKWTSTYRSTFSSFAFSSTQTNPSAWTVNTAADTTWSSDNDNGSGAKPYVPLKYTSIGTTQATQITYTCASKCTPATQTLGSSGAPFYQSNRVNIDSSSCNNKPACLQNPSWCNWHDTRRRRRRTSDNRRRYRRSVEHPDVALAKQSASQRRDTDDSVCTYRQFVDVACQRLEEGDGWRNSKGSAGGCYYSAGGWTYYHFADAYPSAGPAFFLRSSQDPFITAQSVTKGTMNFGNTQAQNATIGGSLLGVGLCFMLPLLCGLFLLMRQQRSNNASEGVVMDNASNYASNQPGMPPEPVYGNASNYGNPQPPPPMPDAKWDQPLPPFWQETADPSTGKMYYYNAQTNETSWDRPTY